MTNHDKRKRAAELGQLTSQALGKQLAAAGYRLTGRRRKQDKVSALLHLEGFPISPEIVTDLGLVKV